KKTKILLIIIALLINFLQSQSIDQYKELLEIYNKSKNMNIGESSFGAQSTNNNINNLDDQLKISHLYKKSIDINLKGHWNSKEDYKKWMDESSGDPNVMLLYGFVEDYLPYFGYDIFTQLDSLLFWPNISIPDNYVLGPGDNIEISIWGQAQLHALYTINRDGNIFDNNIGIVNLAGKTLKESRIFIMNKFSQKYSSLRGDNPQTFINVTLGALKSINVHFIGNVKIPGVQLVNPMSSIITGLFQAGGVDPTGSLRSIQVHRNGKLYKEIDLYSYLLNSDLFDNLILQNDDIIYVPPRISTITVDGEVFRRGKFEALQSEVLASVIKFSGGMKPNASKDIILRRIVPVAMRNSFKEPIEYKTITVDQLDKVAVQDGDYLTIGSIPNIVNEVIVSGQVKTPGSYVLTDSMTIKDILIRAGGIEDKNYLKSAYLDKIEVVRVDENSDKDIVIDFNYNDVINTDKYANFQLQKDDQVIVRKNIYYQKGNNVTINGEVQIPGLYPIKETDKTLEEIIHKAGGFTDMAFMDGIEITRNNKTLVWKNFSIPLIKGDIVFVPQKPGTIEVKGEVYNPGLIHFTKGQTVMSYVRSAGGLTSNAKRFNITLMYPNGNVKTKKYFPRKVMEGCTIIVQRKSEKNPFDILTIFRETATIVSSIALTYIAIKSTK
ncbi:SLBB domain-containing protein, partial [Candidatus Neomarinimicrobiota bacterium]